MVKTFLDCEHHHPGKEAGEKPTPDTTTPHISDTKQLLHQRAKKLLMTKRIRSEVSALSYLTFCNLSSTKPCIPNGSMVVHIIHVSDIGEQELFHESRRSHQQCPVQSVQPDYSGTLSVITVFYSKGSSGSQ